MKITRRNALKIIGAHGDVRCQLLLQLTFSLSAANETREQGSQIRDDHISS